GMLSWRLSAGSARVTTGMNPRVAGRDSAAAGRDWGQTVHQEVDVNLKQPGVGLVSTALVIVISLAFVSLFDFPTFSGWVAYFLLCVIPMQIVIAVTWGSNPNFAAARKQPAKGLLLTMTSLLVGAVVAALFHRTIGGSINPPTPMLAI